MRFAHKNAIFFVGHMTLVAGAASTLQAQSSGQQRLNIISILTDDQALWTLSCYGSKESLTPSLDRIAASGARFTNAFTATPVCSPSRATSLTGRYSTQLGVTDFLTVDEENKGAGLRPGTVTWPEVLRKNGYATALMGKWHLGRQPATMPDKFGFERFYGFLGAGAHPTAPVFHFSDGPRKLSGCTADLITTEALTYIAEMRDRPFALSLHYREPHEPYGPMPEVDTRALADLDAVMPDAPGLDATQVKRWRREYFTAVHAVDRNVGRLIDALELHRLWEKTVIVFTSDHGYNIGEHTIHGKGNAMWIAAGVDGPRRPNLWDSSLRVPLLVRWPGAGKPGVVIEDVVSNVDTFASILGMLGVVAPAASNHAGVDFSARLRGETTTPRDAFFAQYDLHNLGLARMRAVRTGRWKLVRHFESSQLDELYDLVSDPDERRNLMHWGVVRAPTPDQAKALADLDVRLRAWMRETGDPLLVEK